MRANEGAAYKEIKQPKVGRLARLTGKVEKIAPSVPPDAKAPAEQLDPAVEAEVHEMLERMRAEERASWRRSRYRADICKVFV